ncbi:hypothetical protein M5E88_07530 [Akkermansia muciniphila]|nr:hypothetical protein M5E88_07530 [Akkermansia muciniphila]
MVGTGIICLFMATFMSHTATASLLIPIIAVVGVNMGDNLAPMGGVTALLVSVAFASSLGMSLPISTPQRPGLCHRLGQLQGNGHFRRHSGYPGHDFDLRHDDDSCPMPCFLSKVMFHAGTCCPGMANINGKSAL